MIVVTACRHLGPGPHPGGSPQSVHGKPGLAVHEDAPIYTEPAEAEYSFNWEGGPAGEAVWNKAADFYQSEFSDWAKSLPKDSIEALNIYAGDDYRAINRYLRSVQNYGIRKDNWGGYGKQKVGSWAYGIDNSLGTYSVSKKYAHRLSRPLLVYRGMSDKRLAHLSVGDVYSDRAFLSTAMMLRGIQGTMFDKGAICHIHLPKGTRVATTGVGYDDRKIGLDGESEILLPRRSRLRLNKKWVEGSKTHYDFTYLGSDDEKYLGMVR